MGPGAEDDVTKLDLIVLGLLALSGVVGFVRGAAREVAALVALVAASVLAIVALPLSSPMVREFVQPAWLGAAAALLAVFAVTYLALRLIGAGVARQIQRTDLLGTLDRSAGLLIGLARGLLVLGALYLMFNAATPLDLRPKWITEAKTWPLARNMGNLLSSLAPQGLDVAGRLRPAFDKALRDGTGDRSMTDGYEPPQRSSSAETSR
jgi:membrane protein required for colicin V production